MTRTTQTKHMNTQRQSREDTIRIDPTKVGALIGKGGTTIKGLANRAGDGCRINADRQDSGLIRISARNTLAIARAKQYIKEHLQQFDTSRRQNQVKPNPRRPSSIPTTQTNISTGQFDCLQDPKSPSAGHKKPGADKKKKKFTPVNARWRDAPGGIRERKRQNWARSTDFKRAQVEWEAEWKALPASTREDWQTFRWNKQRKFHSQRDQMERQNALDAANRPPKASTKMGFSALNNTRAFPTMGKTPCAPKPSALWDTPSQTIFSEESHLPPTPEQEAPLELEPIASGDNETSTDQPSDNETSTDQPSDNETSTDQPSDNETSTDQPSEPKPKFKSLNLNRRISMIPPKIVTAQPITDSWDLNGTHGDYSPTASDLAEQDYLNLSTEGDWDETDWA